MKITTFLTVLYLLLLTSCGGRGTSDVGIKISVGNLIDVYPAGVMFYGRRKDNPYVFIGQRVDNPGQTISLENGDWEFMVVAWDGSNGPFTLQSSTSMKCGFTDASLTGGDVDLNFVLSYDNCGHYNSSTGEIDGGALNPGMFDVNYNPPHVKPLKLSAMVAISPDGTHSEVDGAFNGSAVLTLYNVKSDGTNITVSEGMSSGCINLSSGTVATNLYFPTANKDDYGAKPFASRITMFANTNCSGEKTVYEFKEGLGGLDRNYHITELMTNHYDQYEMQVVYVSPTTVSFSEGSNVLTGINGAIGIFPVGDVSGTDVTKTFTITNTGDSDLNTFGIDLKYKVTGEFSIGTNSCGIPGSEITLPAGGSCSFDITLGYDTSELEFFDIVKATYSGGIAYMAVTGKSFKAFHMVKDLSFAGEDLFFDYPAWYTNKSSVTATWEHPESTDIDHYTVEFFSEYDCSTGSLYTTSNIAADQLSYTYSGSFSNESSVAFKVTSFDGVGNSAVSECSSKYIKVFPDNPAGASSLTSAVGTSGSFDASWVNDTTSVIKKQVMRVYDDTVTDCSTGLLHTIDLTPDVTSQNVIPNGGVLGTYYYNIETIDKFGRSTLSSCQQADNN